MHLCHEALATATASKRSNTSEAGCRRRAPGSRTPVRPRTAGPCPGVSPVRRRCRAGIRSRRVDSTWPTFTIRPSASAPCADALRAAAGGGARTAAPRSARATRAPGHGEEEFVQPETQRDHLHDLLNSRSRCMTGDGDRAASVVFLSALDLPQQALDALVQAFHRVAQFVDLAHELGGLQRP